MPYPSPSLFPGLSLLPGVAAATGGKFVLRDVYISVNGIVISDYAHGLKFEQTVEAIDVTGYDSTTKQYLPGAREIRLEFDLWAGNQTAHQALQFAHDTGSAVPVEVRAHQLAASTSNPSHAAVCKVTKYRPYLLDVGEGAGADVELIGEPTAITTTGVFPSTSLYPSVSLFPSP